MFLFMQIGNCVSLSIIQLHIFKRKKKILFFIFNDREHFVISNKDNYNVIHYTKTKQYNFDDR